MALGTRFARLDRAWPPIQGYPYACQQLRRTLSATMLLLLAMHGRSARQRRAGAARDHGRHDAEVAKAQQAFDETVAAANDKAIKAYARIAQRLTRANDVAGAGAAWKEVMRLQRSNAEARSFFTTMNTLDDVLKELDAPPTDLLGNPIVTGSEAGRRWSSTARTVRWCPPPERC